MQASDATAAGTHGMRIASGTRMSCDGHKHMRPSTQAQPLPKMVQNSAHSGALVGATGTGAHSVLAGGNAGATAIFGSLSRDIRLKEPKDVRQ